MRFTNSTDVDPDTISGVWISGTSYRVVFKNGQACTFRRVQLTEEARQLLEQRALEQRG